MKEAGLPSDGKLQLRDGRTGEEFEQRQRLVSCIS
jgi:DNA-directed RNA polymerase beta subunit